MIGLRDVVQPYVGTGPVPGAVALVAHGDQVEIEAVGSVDVEGTAPMARDTEGYSERPLPASLHLSRRRSGDR